MESINHQSTWFCYSLGSHFIFQSAEGETEESLERNFLTSSEAVDELFITTLNIIRDTATGAIRKICDFIGEQINFVCIHNLYLWIILCHHH